MVPFKNTANNNFRVKVKNENTSCTFFSVRDPVNYVNENVYIWKVISDNSKIIIDKEISLK